MEKAITPRTSPPRPDDLLAALPPPESIALEAIPGLLGELERVKALLWTRLLRPSQRAAEAPQDEDRLLTVPEVAARLALKPAYVYELLRQGRLRAVRTGKYVRVRPSALAAFLAAGQQPAIDGVLYARYSSPRDRGGATGASKAAEAHPGTTGRAPRRRGQHRGTVGA